MPMTPSPLRYPGGKTKIYDYIKKILEQNRLIGQTYIEPFAGGAGLAIKLLLNGDVNCIVINDFDISIFSFWQSVLSYTDKLCDMIANIEVTPKEWYRQREIYLKQDEENVLKLGFATFFLNRTNISGVIKGGMIGGISQTGTNSIDARFNKVNLIKKIRNIAFYGNQIHLYNLDAQKFLESDVLEQFENVFINFDPPYVKKGAKLYKNSFNESDHKVLSEAISRCEKKWIVTYDICPLVANLYSKFRHSYLDVTYSIKSSKKAQEYIFFCDDLIIPNTVEIKNKI